MHLLQHIRLVFADKFGLEDSENCMYDRVTIYDGSQSNLIGIVQIKNLFLRKNVNDSNSLTLSQKKHTSMNNRFLFFSSTKGKYCGSQHPGTMVLSSNHVIVQFTSDDSNGDIGFLLHWSATNGTCICCLQRALSELHH